MMPTMKEARAFSEGLVEGMKITDAPSALAGRIAGLKEAEYILDYTRAELGWDEYYDFWLAAVTAIHESISELEKD